MITITIAVTVTVMIGSLSFEGEGPVELGVGVDQPHVQLAHVAAGQGLLAGGAAVDDGLLFAEIREELLLRHDVQGQGRPAEVAPEEHVRERGACKGEGGQGQGGRA